MVCLITYDLKSPGQNYEKVIQAIKDVSAGVWCSFWESSYLIKTHFSIQQVSDFLNPLTDSNDSLFIIEVKDSYRGQLELDQWDYIRDNIFN